MQPNIDEVKTTLESGFGLPIWGDGKISINPNGAIPSQADTVIIGGGFTGLTTALSLAKAGKKVILLEQHHIGYGASSRNAGFCTIAPAASAQSILKQYGERGGLQYFRWFLGAVDAVQQLVEDESMNIDWQTTGRLSLSRSSMQSERLKRNFEIQRGCFDFPVELIQGNDLRDHIGIDGFHSAISDVKSGCLNPMKLVSELSRLAVRNGVFIHENTKVLGIRELVSSVEVTYSGGSVKAKNILIATNAYSSSMNINANNFIVPLGSYIIATEPLSEEQRHHFLPSNKVASTISNYSNYFRILDNGCLIFGGRKSLSENTNLENVAKELHKNAEVLFPGLKIPKVAACWGGKLAFTSDRTPLLGKVSERIYFAGGYCGHGVPTSISSGLEIAKDILNKNVSDCPFFSTEIKGSLKNWLGRNLMPAVGLYYRYKDKLELS